MDREDLLEKPVLKTKSYVVCSAHFEESAIKTKRFLRPDAVPTIPSKGPPAPPATDDDAHISTTTSEVSLQPNIKVMTITSAPRVPETKVVVASATQTDQRLDCANSIWKNDSHVQTQTPQEMIDDMIKDSSLIRKLNEDLREADHKRRRLERELTKIRNELEAKTASITSDPEDDINRRFQKLIDWQNKFRSRHKGNRYHEEYKMFAVTLHYSSPQTYKCLETVLNLPSKSTLKRFKVNISPKLGKRTLRSLALKMETLPVTAQYCTISVNKMVLKRNLHYDVKTDEVIGIQNVNGKKSPNIANNAYVIMLQGINYDWSQPIAYALLDSTENYFEMDAWINKVIRKLSREGIEVKAMITQQGSNFDTIFKKLKNITVDQPYFFVDESKIYYVVDVANLLMWTRIDLMSNDFHRKKEVISWDYIKALYEDQKKKNLTLIPDITDAHIYTVWLLKSPESMKLKSAMEIFSYTMHAALETYIDFGKLSEDARATAQFIKVLHDLLEALNSKDETVKNTGSSITLHQKHVLEKALSMFACLKSYERGTANDNTQQIKTLCNFQITIRSILGLLEEMQEAGFQYISTKCLSQSNLETFFKSITMQQGNSAQPTPLQFTRTYSKLFLSNMLNTSLNTHIELNMYDILLKAEAVVETKVTEPQAKTSLICLDDENDYEIDLPTTNAIPYVASYLLFKCAEKHARCDDLEGLMNSLQDFAQIELFTEYEDCNKDATFHGSLKIPPKEVIAYVETLDTIFVDNFIKCIGDEPGNKIFELMRCIPPVKLCTCYPTNYFLKLFLALRISATIKLNNNNFRGRRHVMKQYMVVTKL